jgi:hypothetical protein
LSKIASLIDEAFSILFVAHDAGGGNALISYSFKLEKDKHYCLSGPSVNIAKERNIPTNSITEDIDLTELQKFDLVMASTGWETDFEVSKIEQAIQIGLPVLVLLDHWTDFDKRLLKNGKRLTPSGILVTDERAHKIAQAVFPDLEIMRVENAYLKIIKDEYIRTKSIQQTKDKKTILYLCEPSLEPKETDPFLRKDRKRLIDFIQFLNLIPNFTDRVLVRLHPSENLSKYVNVVEQSKVQIQISEIQSLTEDLARADVSVGFETMALHVSKSLGIPSFTLDEIKNVKRSEFFQILSEE